jgi:DNA-binding response OmpR family regulator
VIRINGQQFDLTCKETSLLMLLATTPGQVWTKEMLLDGMYCPHEI